MASHIFKFDTMRAMTNFLVSIASGFDYDFSDRAVPKLFIRYHEYSVLAIFAQDYELESALRYYQTREHFPLTFIENVSPSMKDQLILFLDIINSDRFVHLSGISWGEIQDAEFAPGLTVKQFLNQLVDGTTSALEALVVLFDTVPEYSLRKGVQDGLSDNPYRAIFILQHMGENQVKDLMDDVLDYDARHLIGCSRKAAIHQALELDIEEGPDLEDLYFSENYRL